MEWLRYPPAVFVIIFAVSAAIMFFLSRYAFRPKEQTPDARKGYACGEDMPSQFTPPNYNQFFRFAYYFTILHVVALFITTVPVHSPGALVMGVIYILSAVIGLVIMLEK